MNKIINVSLDDMIEYLVFINKDHDYKIQKGIYYENYGRYYKDIDFDPYYGFIYYLEPCGCISYGYYEEDYDYEEDYLIHAPNIQSRCYEHSLKKKNSVEIEKLFYNEIFVPLEEDIINLLCCLKYVNIKVPKPIIKIIAKLVFLCEVIILDDLYCLLNSTKYDLMIDLINMGINSFNDPHFFRQDTI